MADIESDPAKMPQIHTFIPLHHTTARVAAGEPLERHPTDFDDEEAAQSKPAARTRWGPTISLAFVGLGVIYGDLGTSPLYALNGLFPSAGALPSEEDIIGGVSA